MKNIILILLLAVNIFAKNNINQKYDDISHSYSECLAYFSIIGLATKDEAEFRNIIKDKWGITKEFAIMYAYIANRTRENAEQIVDARKDAYVRSLSSEINDNISDALILTKKYQQRCLDLIEFPEKILKKNKETK